jgi:tetratricopeptide (TPR) repeat protein
MQRNSTTATDLQDSSFFEGKDLRVVLRLFERDPDLFITFTGRAANPPVPSGFGETFFRKRGLSAVHFISKANHWWQTPEVDQAIAALREAGILSGKRQITLYGSSMGGYAVLVRSAGLKPSQILAVSPQYSIDGKVVPFEWRWRNYAAKLSFDYDDMDTGLDREARLLVVVDSFFRPDALHLRLIESHRPVEVVRISFAGHNTARALEEIGLATRLVTEVAQGRFDNMAFCRDYRRGRPASSLFWYGLADYLAGRGRRGWALAAVTLAAHLMLSGSRMRDPTLQRDILELAIELSGEARLGVALSQWLSAFEAHSPSPRLLAKARAQTALALGRASEAMEHVRELLRVGAEEADYAVVIATLDANNRHGKAEGILTRAATSNCVPLIAAAGESLLENGEAASALPLLARAVALDHRSIDARILLAAAHLAVGDEAAAREAFRDTAGMVPASPAIAARLVAVVAALDGEVAALAVQGRIDRMREAQTELMKGLGDIDPAAVGQGVRALIGRVSGG